MITNDELEMFIDGLIEPCYISEPHCTHDSCPIDFGGGDDNK